MRYLILAAMLLSAALAAFAQEQASPVPEEYKTPAVPETPIRFEGNLVNQGGGPAWLPLSGHFSLTIDRWTSEEEAAQLKTIMVDGRGQEGVLDWMWKGKQIGYMTFSGSQGKPIFIARAIPVPGGLIVRAVTYSHVAQHGINSRDDYPFVVVEFTVPNKGTGQGTLVGMAGIEMTRKGEIRVEAYGFLPAKLLNVEIDVPRKKKKK